MRCEGGALSWSLGEKDKLVGSAERIILTLTNVQLTYTSNTVTMLVSAAPMVHYSPPADLTAEGNDGVRTFLSSRPMPRTPPSAANLDSGVLS
jgi:hypothetical protein